MINVNTPTCIKYGCATGDCTDVNIFAVVMMGGKAVIATLASIVRQRALMITTLCMDSVMKIKTVSVKLDAMATSVIS